MLTEQCLIQLFAKENAAHPEQLKRNKQESIPSSQALADVAGIAWFCLSVHECIRNGVSVSSFF